MIFAPAYLRYTRLQGTCARGGLYVRVPQIKVKGVCDYVELHRIEGE